MKNDSTPRGDCFSCKFCQELNKEYYCHRTTAHEKVDANYDCEDFLSKSQQHNVADSTPSEGWDLESLIAQEIGYISGIFMSQGDTKAKDIIMPTEELKEVADRINLYCFKEIAKARQETRQEIKEWVESYNKRSDGINKSDLLKELEEE